MTLEQNDYPSLAKKKIPNKVQLRIYLFLGRYL